MGTTNAVSKDTGWHLRVGQGDRKRSCADEGGEQETLNPMPRPILPSTLPISLFTCPSTYPASSAACALPICGMLRPSSDWIGNAKTEKATRCTAASAIARHATSMTARACKVGGGKGLDYRPYKIPVIAAVGPSILLERQAATGAPGWWRETRWPPPLPRRGLARLGCRCRRHVPLLRQKLLLLQAAASCCGNAAGDGPSAAAAAAVPGACGAAHHARHCVCNLQRRVGHRAPVPGASAAA